MRPIGIGLFLSATNALALPAEWGGVTPLIDWDFALAVQGSGIITSVPDATGNGRVLTSASGHEPAYVASSANFNGKPAGSFLIGGTVPRMTFGDLGAVANGAISVALVGVNTNAGANRYAFSLAGDNLYINSPSATLQWRARANASLISTTVATSSPAVALHTVPGISATHRLYVSAQTEKGNALTTTSLTYSGGGSVGNYVTGPTDAFSWNGEIARIIVWGSDVSANRAAIFAALGAKYGISIGA